MNHVEVGKLWEASAEAWTKLARAGHDVFRDHLNTPAFFEMLPSVKGLVGLDLGCGEGHNTRLLARRGAAMTAVDIAGTFIRLAQAEEVRAPLGITYREASAVELPFAEASFDFAAAFMSFMDIPETERVVSEAFRVLRPGGFLQFSILHPCFHAPYRKACRDEDGFVSALEVGDYFIDADGRVLEWTFGAATQSGRDRQPKFKLPRFHRSISHWCNVLIEAGFVLERFAEPCPTTEAVSLHSSLQEAQVAPYFLHVRVRKPRSSAGDR